MSDPTHVLCNGAPGRPPERSLRLDYLGKPSVRNVRLGLPLFVEGVLHVPERTLDLLELAAFIYAADRSTRRGLREAVEFQAWSRAFRFRLKVRDHAFWARPEVQDALNACLSFMTGDRSYEFEFLPGHSTPPTSLFDQSGFGTTGVLGSAEVALFSGGLDSLSGAVRCLDETDKSLILVSHHSQPETKRVQKSLIAALQSQFPGRVFPYGFECTLSRIRAAEETQRSRSFLYAAIGYAVAEANKTTELFVYENGVTSINLRRREDLGNARASRTTHPQTIGLLSEFLTVVADRPFSVRTPNLWSTKRDIVEQIATCQQAGLIATSVSCSRTFLTSGNATQCGQCFQCLDRRIAVFAAGAEDHDDAGQYGVDATHRSLPDGESRTTALDYLRQAAFLALGGPEAFYHEYLADLAEIVDWLPMEGSHIERVEAVWKLLHRHGQDVQHALVRMREAFDVPLSPLSPLSLPGLVATREYEKPPVAHLIARIAGILRAAAPTLLRAGAPKNENQLNRRIHSVLMGQPGLESEHASVPFACARVIPDHSLQGHGLLIEAKFVRRNTPPSKATDGMAADLIKYPQDAHILFVVYDPTRRILDDVRFCEDFQSRGRCTVLVLR